MTRQLIAVLSLFLFAAATSGEDSASWDFEDAKTGELPAGWVAAKTGTGPGSVWKIVEVEEGGKKTHALAQTSLEGDDSLFNLCVAEKGKYVDVDLSVSIEAIKGVNDQGGGLVWRYSDANNYYITRWRTIFVSTESSRASGHSLRPLK